MRPATDMRCPALVGRAGERAAIDEVLAAAADGRGGVVALEGDAGVGKSRLARAAAECAEATGMTVLSASEALRLCVVVPVPPPTVTHGGAHSA